MSDEVADFYEPVQFNWHPWTYDVIKAGREFSESTHSEPEIENCEDEKECSPFGANPTSVTSRST